MEGPQRDPDTAPRVPGDADRLERLLAALSEAAARLDGAPNLQSAATLFLSTLRSQSCCRRAVLTVVDEEGRDHQWFFVGLTNAEIDHFHAHRPSGAVRDAVLEESHRVGAGYVLPIDERRDPSGLRPNSGAAGRAAEPQEKADLLILPLRAPDARLLGTIWIDDGRHQGSRPAALVSCLALFSCQMSRFLERLRFDQSARSAQIKLRQTEEQLLQADKLSAIGQLISGVAHELNNPLSGVMGFTQLLQASETNPKAQKNLERIYNEAVRCQRIVNNLLTFARRHRPEKRAHVLNDVIEEVLDLRAYQLAVDDVEVVRRYQGDLPATQLDSHQLQQVILNLVNNAHQAMSATSGRKRQLTIVTEMRDGRVRASFTDTGNGIPKERMARIFEPFFTTKEPGKGTGIGLSVSLGIVKDHQGTMSVDSVVGEGTTFQFDLPVIEGAAPEAHTPPPAPKASAPAVSLRVLVVDDEAILTELLTDLLKSVGHEVEHARDGRVALRMAQQGGFDVILSDLKMPGLDGQGLYEALCQERPEMKNRFIFTTGDVVNPDVRSFFQRTGCAYLSKPFKLEAVLQVVDQVAGSRQAA